MEASTNWFDLSIAGLILFYALHGMREGFGRAAIGLAAFILAMWCAFRYYGEFGFWLRSYIDPPAAASGVGFILIFGGVSMLGALAAAAAARSMNDLGSKSLDRLLGGCCGGFHGILAAGLVVVGLMAFGPKHLSGIAMRSRVAPILADAGVCAVKSAPDEVREGFERARRDLDKVLPEKVRERPGTSRI